MAELIQGVSEAFVISTFGTILFMVVCYESFRQQISTTGELTEDLPVGETIVQALAQQGTKPHFATPPFFCCFARCCYKHNMLPKHLLRVSWLIRQYVYMQMSLSVFSMWAATTISEREGRSVQMATLVVLKVSAMTAVYGLFVLYRATHDLLHDWNTTRKFISVKLVIFLSLLQKQVLTRLIHRFRKDATSCLIDPWDAEDLEHVVNFWSQFVLLLDTLILIWLIVTAFPAEEVNDFRQHHAELVELELAHSHMRHMKIDDSDDDDTSCDDGA